jgi:hypothetical protein
MCFHLQDKIARRKDRITDLIRENTNRLEQLNMLLGEKKDYEGELDSRQKNLVSVVFKVVINSSGVSWPNG